MSRRGVLGYQEGNTLFRPRPLPRRAVPLGVFSLRRSFPVLGVPKLSLPSPPPPPLVAPKPAAVVVVAVILCVIGDPNKLGAVSASSERTPRAPARRRAKTVATSTGLDSLSLASGMVAMSQNWNIAKDQKIIRQRTKKPTRPISEKTTQISVSTVTLNSKPSFWSNPIWDLQDLPETIHFKVENKKSKPIFQTDPELKTFLLIKPQFGIFKISHFENDPDPVSDWKKRFKDDPELKMIQIDKGFDPNERMLMIMYTLWWRRCKVLEVCCSESVRWGAFLRVSIKVQKSKEGALWKRDRIGKFFKVKNGRSYRQQHNLTPKIFTHVFFFFSGGGGLDSGVWFKFQIVSMSGNLRSFAIGPLLCKKMELGHSYYPAGFGRYVDYDGEFRHVRL